MGRKRDLDEDEDDDRDSRTREAASNRKTWLIVGAVVFVVVILPILIGLGAMAIGFAVLVNDAKN